MEAAETTSWTHTSTAQQVRYGPGVSQRLRPVLRDLGVRRALLITSAARLETELGQAVAGGMSRQLSSTFAEVVEHAPVPAIQAAAMQARSEGVDGLVSLGGGSAIDTAKAVGFFLEREAGTPGASFADRPSLPHVAVPTTWCGAAHTSRFSMTDPTSRHKTLGAGPTVAPIVAVCDVELIATTPLPLLVTSGMAALATAIEVALSGQRTPEAEALALAAIGRLWGALPALVDADATQRPAVVAAVTQAAVLAGRASDNAELGMVHGLSVLLGGRAGVAHGHAAALLLAPVLRFVQDVTGDRVEQIGAAVGTEDLATGVEELVAELGIAARLSDLGVGDADIEAVARLSQQNPAVRASPRPAGEADARALLEAAF